MSHKTGKLINLNELAKYDRKSLLSVGGNFDASTPASGPIRNGRFVQFSLFPKSKGRSRVTNYAIPKHKSKRD